jgi:hypothetical protein
MVSRLFWSCGPSRATVLALAVLGMLPATLQAAWLGFRNDLAVPVVIQRSILINNQLRPEKAQVLYPGDVILEPVLRPGNWTVTIAEYRKPRRMMFQDTILINADKFFSVQTAGPAKVKLVPARMPIPPRRPGR